MNKNDLFSVLYALELQGVDFKVSRVKFTAEGWAFYRFTLEGWDCRYFPDSLPDQYYGYFELFPVAQ